MGREDIARDWREFLLTGPASMAECSGWLSLKAAEHQLDFYELSTWLIVGVERPYFPAPVEPDKNLS